MRGIVLSAVLLAAAPAFGQFSPAQIEKFEKAIEEAEKTWQEAVQASLAYQTAAVGRDRLLSESVRLLLLAISRQVTPETVKAIFGAPTGVEVTTCGGNHPGKEWTCKALWYGLTGFFFQQVDGKWVLNSYSIKR
jgi:hypothetical protein